MEKIDGITHVMNEFLVNSILRNDMITITTHAINAVSFLSLEIRAIIIPITHDENEIFVR